MRTTLILTLAILIAPAGLTHAWTMENADPQNTGHLDQTTPGTLSDPLETPLDGDVIAQPIQGPASLALAGTLTGTLYAITATGDEAFRVDLDGEIRNAPLWTGDLIIVLPRSDTAHALTPIGEEAWTLDVANERPDADVVRMASPTPHPTGDILLPTLSGEIHRVTPDGTLQWTHDTGDDRSIQATPTVTQDGHILVASFTPGQAEEGLLELLDADTGEPHWDVQLASQTVGAPTLIGNLIILPLRDGNTIEARTLTDPSTVQYTVPFDDRITMSPTVHEGTAIAGDISGVLRAFDLKTGDEAWTFHPSEDDPDWNPGPLGVVEALAIADSPAIDANGHAWVPYWNADLSTCCPPTESMDSPFYILDAHNEGEIIDRETYDQAAHGSALHDTGVWIGTDEQRLRAYTNPNVLQADAFIQDRTVTLVTNTDLSGEWTLDIGPHQETGTGMPPVITHRSLEPGDHTITVTVDDVTTQTSIAVHDPDAPHDEQEPENETPNGDDTRQDEPTTDPREEPDDSEEESEDTIPVGLLAPLLATLIAAWRRPRE